MKNLLVLFIMVLAFNLSNAQDTLGDGFYGQVGVNLKQVIGNDVATTEFAFGYVGNGADIYLAAERLSGFNDTIISFGTSAVLQLHKECYLNLGGVIGNSLSEASEFYYSPDISLRIHPNSSETFSFIFQGTLPQTNINGGDFNLNNPVFRLKLRVNF
jgi:hypothetical protein